MTHYTVILRDSNSTKANVLCLLKRNFLWDIKHVPLTHTIRLLRTIVTLCTQKHIPHTDDKLFQWDFRKVFHVRLPLGSFLESSHTIVPFLGRLLATRTTSVDGPLSRTRLERDWLRSFLSPIWKRYTPTIVFYSTPPLLFNTHDFTWSEEMRLNLNPNWGDQTERGPICMRI